MYVKRLLHAWYIHGDEHAHNFSSPGGGSNSLKWTSVEGEGVHVKRTGTNKWGGRSKTKSLEGTYFLNDPKPLEVLRWNFDPVNKISLRLKQTKKQKYFLHMRKYLILKIGQILETNYHIFGILKWLLSLSRDMPWPWYFSKVCLLDKRSWLVTSFLIFADFSKKLMSGL